MTSYQEVFERKEVKYRLDAAQRHAMLTAIERRMAVDDYGTTSIASRYFDTPDRALIERSLDKPLYKEKLRVRSYGIPGEDDQVFVELKKKYQGIVYKRRVGCSYAAARAYMGGMPYEQACCEFPLPDPILAEASLSPRSLQIAREIDAFKERYSPLRASMMTICDRTAYAPLAIGGEGEATGVPSTLRITFDENVAYRDLFEETLIARASHRRPPVGFGMPRPLLPADEAIMEVKCAGPFPLWLVDALGGCGRRAPYSDLRPALPQ
ncbi:VTC domain-containing protein [Ellagibacter isourolithinifaciens]|uniref:VTC domain-containing protein n=1 Tax=Ellagibacter isourolithinifaciens TaxID=2137581 RepID=UPI003A8F95EB